MKGKVLFVFLLCVFFIAPHPADAARLNTIGFELNTCTADVELTRCDEGGTVTTISSAQAHSGTYSMRANTSSSFSGGEYDFSAGTGVAFLRAYFYVVSYPDSNSTLVWFQSSGGSLSGGAFMNSSGQIGVSYYLTTNPTYGAVLSAAVSKNVWHYLEVKVDSTVNNQQVVTVRLDGTQIDSENGTRALGTNVNAQALLGTFGMGNESGTQDVYYDDVAINDNSGASQTSFAGPGNVIRLSPSAAGDANAWIRGGADSGANWSQVDETTPNDITDYVFSTTLNNEDLYNMTDSGIGASDTVNVVQECIRFRGDNAASEPTFKGEIEKTSGGTLSQGSAITPNSTTWRSNANASPFNPTLTLYNDPDGAAWTKTTLDSMQAGVKLTTDSTNNNQVSDIWVYVDYTPGAVAVDRMRVRLSGGRIRIQGGRFRLQSN